MVAPFIERDRKRAWLSGVPVCLAHNLRADWVQAVGGYQSAAATTRTVRSTLRSAVRGRQGERVICRPQPTQIARSRDERSSADERGPKWGKAPRPCWGRREICQNNSTKNSGVPSQRHLSTVYFGRYGGTRDAALPVNLKEPSSSNADSGCMRPAAMVAKSADALHRPSVLRAQAGHDPPTEYSATGPLLGAASRGLADHLASVGSP